MNEKKETPSDNVKAQQPDENLMRAAFGQKDASPSPLVSEADEEKNLEEPGGVAENTVKGPMEVWNAAQIWLTELMEVGPDLTNNAHRKLVHEASEYAANPTVEEAADVFICLAASAMAKRWTFTQLTEATATKVEINRKRHWKQLHDGTWQHEQVPSVEPAGPKSDSGSEYSQAPTSLETGGRNALNLQMALEALEPFKLLSDKFDHRPYNEGYADALRINGTGDDSKADVVRIHNFITLGDCRKAKAAFVALEKCLSENGPKSEGAVEVSSDAFTQQRREFIHRLYYGRPFNMDSAVDFIDEVMAFVKSSSPNPSPSPSEANAQAMEELPCPWCAKQPEIVGILIHESGGVYACRTLDCPAAGFSVKLEHWNKRVALHSTIKEQPQEKDLEEQ